MFLVFIIILASALFGVIGSFLDHNDIMKERASYALYGVMYGTIMTSIILAVVESGIH